MSRKKYATQCKSLIAAGVNPNVFGLDKIPPSNLHRWRHTNFNKYFGYTWNNIPEEQLALAGKAASLVLDDRYSTVFNIIIRASAVIKTIFNAKHHLQNASLEIKRHFVSVIDRAQNIIPHSIILKLWGFSATAFHAIKKQVTTLCLTTVIQRCPRYWPQQISSGELHKMETPLRKPEHLGWSTHAVAMRALRDKEVNVSVGSWYRYIKILGIERKKAMNRRKKHCIGIRADLPNQLWHCDVLVFKPLDNTKVYIYLTLDNFSRFILSWKTSLQLSMEIRLQSVLEAIENYGPPNGNLALMTDGGSENNSLVSGIYECADKKILLQKIIAQKDVLFSNSMIEAANKTVKYRCLYLHDIHNHQGTNKHMTKWVPVYNYEIIHTKHKFYTPAEVFTGFTIDENALKQQIKSAYRQRLEINRKSVCDNCR